MEEQAAEAEAAWQHGKIAIGVQLCRLHPVVSLRRTTVYPALDARLADVRRVVAEQWPTSWRSWILMWADQ